MTNPLFSWQTSAWDYLQSLQGRMPHAFLLHGPEGIGKTVFAEHMAKSLLCEQPDAAGHACGACGSCGWFSQYSHPDAAKTSKASKTPSKEIVINQIRALADFMNLSTHRQGRRVIVLYPAEALNIPAANALLKSLEEPGADTVFILVSNSIDKLLPTILSRCHKLPMGMPERSVALAWLKQRGVSDADVWLAQQGGAPLAALAMAESDTRTELDDFLRQLARPSVDTSLKLADKMQKMEMPVTVAWMQRWLYDLFSYKQSGRIRYYPRYEKEVKALASAISNEALLSLIKSSNERQAIATHPLSPKLFLEDMLLEYSALFA